jgi:hypothetical protein
MSFAICIGTQISKFELGKNTMPSDKKNGCPSLVASSHKIFNLNLLQDNVKLNLQILDLHNARFTKIYGSN